jgi:hypothetical protein
MANGRLCCMSLQNAPLVFVLPSRERGSMMTRVFVRASIPISWHPPYTKNTFKSGTILGHEEITDTSCFAQHTAFSIGYADPFIVLCYT